MSNRAICDLCGAEYGIGDSPYCRDRHEPVGKYFPFTHYFDIGLGAEITSLAQRHRIMKSLGLDYRDKPSKGDLSARRDRCHERRRYLTSR